MCTFYMYPLRFSYKGMHYLSHHHLISLQHPLLPLINLCPFLSVCHFYIKELLHYTSKNISVCLSTSINGCVVPTYIHQITCSLHLSLPLFHLTFSLHPLLHLSPLTHYYCHQNQNLTLNPKIDKNRDCYSP